MKKLPRTLGELRLGEASTCPAGYIMRKAYKTRAGISVSRGCVPDIGKPGKTPPSGQVLPRPEAGGLKGWGHTLPESERRTALRRITKKDGCGTAIKRLNLLANFTKKTSPETHRLAREDMKWLRSQGFCALKT